MKAVRGLEVASKDLTHPDSGLNDEALEDRLRHPTDERLWHLAEALRRGWTVKRVNEVSRVDPWFIEKILALVETESRLVGLRADPAPAQAVMREALDSGFDPATILRLSGLAPEDVLDSKTDRLEPRYKMVDTCAGEFESDTPYYYATRELEDDAAVLQNPITVL